MVPAGKQSHRITIRDVAKAAGTSPSTVSRVLTGSARVSEEKRQAVLAACAELDYTPNMLARALKLRITHTLGLVLADIQSPFFSEAAKGAQDCAAEHAFAVLLCDTNERASKQRQCLEMLHSKKVDGVIWVPTSGALDLARSFLSADMPLVQIDRQVEGLPFGAVIINDEQASAKAVRHLLDNGYHRIAILTVKKSVSSHERRLQGYYRALQDNGVALDERLILRGGSDHDAGYQLTLQALELQPPPDALFATSSRLGVGALQALRDHRVRLCVDMGLVVFDDIPAFALMRPSITAVRQPAYEIGYQAADMLIRRIKTGDDALARQQLVLPAQLVVRESSQPLPE